MRLLPADQRDVDTALRAVRQGGERVTQQPDTEAARQALHTIWADVARALNTLDIAEMNAREAARKRLEMVA